MRGSLLVLVTIGAALAGGASAQGVGNVFGPDVDPGDRAVEYRLGFAPRSGDEDRFAHRLHIEQAVSDRVKLRGLIVGTTAETGDLELIYAQASAFVQVLERTPDGFSSGFRFDLRLAEGDDGASRIGVNWTNQWVFADRWQARAVLLTTRDLEGPSTDGIGFSTRARISRKFESGLRAGLDIYNDYGNTATGPRRFDSQRHQVGPMLSGDLPGDWTWLASSLFGASDAAPDAEFQLQIGHDF